MAKTIEEILGLPALMGLIEETTTGLPQEKLLPDGFRSITRNVIGNSAQATLTKGQRKTSKLIRYNAPPVGVGLETIATRDWILMHSSEELPIDPITFQRLRQYDNWSMQKLGIEEIGRQVGLFKQKQVNLEITAVLMALTKGTIYFDADGDLLPSSAGASDSVDLGVSANHQNQLNGIIAAPWSNPTTDIPLQIRNLRRQASKDTGYMPEMCLYGQNIPGYIQTNAYCKDYLARYPRMNQEFMDTGEIPNGFLDLDWSPAYLAFFEDSAGTNQDILDADGAYFCPKPNKSWYEMVKGSMQIPKTFNPIMNVESWDSNVELVHGMYSFAYIGWPTIRLNLVAGNTFLPTLRNPDVVWQADVVF